MASQPSSEDKLALLYYFQKMYRQRLVKTHVGYQKGLISIKEQVLNWLKEEIYFLKKYLQKINYLT
ncbi:hypothetical protein Q0590_12005 [Rhodocytophaga aerolata]|uniref:Uncharacterized protein n=1 Tax=Rhodocytophaga aerolata TaxID=455078 RepID=A0ABT8R8A0_9BACT|nr:hypothetical protein [Rhodocytophaga aerolata]MDO1446982.1 hypothetical protein [Rhodocytophaga aerolata]